MSVDESSWNASQFPKRIHPSGKSSPSTIKKKKSASPVDSASRPFSRSVARGRLPMTGADAVDHRGCADRGWRGDVGGLLAEVNSPYGLVFPRKRIKKG